MLPREYAPRFALTPAEMFHESDPWTREIFSMGEAVQGRVEAEVAKTVVDLNVDPSHLPPRFPNGAIKSLTAHGRPVWNEDGFPSADEMERLLERYHRPYHEVLARSAGRGGVRLALDCHSLYPWGPTHCSDPGQPRPLFRLGNLGDADAKGSGVTAPPELVMLFKDMLEKEFVDMEPLAGSVLVAVNAPEGDSYTLVRHGKGRTPWIQFDINRHIYLIDPQDHSTVPDSDRDKIGSLRKRLFSVMSELAEKLEQFV